ncbi:winged helix-turn-helix domain-containing protein [bacterium]|nr:winged helix-turn-helix domain-containing protein [bacterium]
MVVNIETTNTAQRFLEKENLWRITPQNLTNATQIVNNRYVDLLCIDTDNTNKQLLDFLKHLKNKRLRTKILAIIPNNTNLKHILLSYGCDDYLQKPYNPEDLVLRCKNLIHCIPTQYEIIYEYNFLRYEKKMDRVMYNDIYIPLTPTEISLTKLLIKRKFISKEEIIHYIESKDGKRHTEQYIVVIVHRIREKIRLCTGRELIDNKYGGGYRLKY